MQFGAVITELPRAVEAPCQPVPSSTLSRHCRNAGRTTFKDISLSTARSLSPRYKQVLFIGTAIFNGKLRLPFITYGREGTLSKDSTGADNRPSPLSMEPRLSPGPSSPTGTNHRVSIELPDAADSVDVEWAHGGGSGSRLKKTKRPFLPWVQRVAGISPSNRLSSHPYNSLESNLES